MLSLTGYRNTLEKQRQFFMLKLVPLYIAMLLRLSTNEHSVLISAKAFSLQSGLLNLVTPLPPWFVLSRILVH